MPAPPPDTPRRPAGHARAHAAILAEVAMASAAHSIVSLGIFFMARRDFGVGRAGSFALALTMVAAYTPTAAFVGPALRRYIARRSGLSSRGVLGGVLLLLGLIAAVPPAAGSSAPWVLWAFMPVAGVLYGIHWPIVEAFVSSTAPRHHLSRSIGRFNLIWSTSAVLSFWVLALLPPEAPTSALYVVAIIQAACAPLVLLLPPEPPPEPDPISHLPTPTERALKEVFQWQLPASYMAILTISPYLPYALTLLGIDSRYKPVIASVWLGTRVVAFAMMGLTPRWHGRAWPSLAAGIGLLVGLAMILLAPVAPGGELAVLITGLACFGLGTGVIYCGALYYAMRCHEHQVEAGSQHEALIGLGYTFGPLCGLGAEGLVWTGLLPETAFAPALVVIVWVVCLGVGGWAWIRAASFAPGNATPRSPV